MTDFALGDASGWLDFTLASWQLGFEASMVLPLRIARLAQGGPDARREARLMVDEKVRAHGELASDFAAGRLGSSVPSVAGGAARHYLRYVRANRQRLMREVCG